jgi:hypothetical protein
LRAPSLCGPPDGERDAADRAAASALRAASPRCTEVCGVEGERDDEDEEIEDVREDAELDPPPRDDGPPDELCDDELCEDELCDDELRDDDVLLALETAMANLLHQAKYRNAKRRAINESFSF